ncbi:peptidoglycan-binding protein, partial [Escherichia coli]
KNVAMNYNGGGDPKYAIKLQFVYTLLTKNRVL